MAVTWPMVVRLAVICATGVAVLWLLIAADGGFGYNPEPASPCPSATSTVHGTEAP